MKTKKIFYSLLSFSFLFLFACSSMHANSKTTILEQPQPEATVTEQVATEVLESVKTAPDRKYFRGIHLTANISGVAKQRLAVMELFDSTELNTAVIDIKETDGRICIDGVKTANENKAYYAVMKNVDAYITKLKEKEVYTVARLVAYCDNVMPRKKTDWAVKNPDGTLWTDRRGNTWLDPYNKEVWDYILEVAERAADLGFEEIQFDYIRFPSDGNIKNCRYSNKNHSSAEASKAIVDFLKEANRRLKEKNVKISIDVFGMTTTATSDMGIGQKIIEMTEWVDYVSPMIYPSHYYKGEYGIPDPNKDPYKTVYIALEGALKRIPAEKLRPWLQDFSMRGVKYGKEEVRAQIQACYDTGVGDWLLWNAACAYTRDALLGNDEERTYEQSDPPTPEMIKTQEKLTKKKQSEAKEQETTQEIEKE